ncbi:MAG: sulfotransferase [Rhodospirillales bacterium]|nr:sulfotransferase [Rhodospirillales bacterium]
MPRLLAEAVGHHRAGRLDRADSLYDRILTAVPDQADAWHLSGLVRHGRGDSEEAFRRIARAIALVPDHAGYRNSLGVVRLETGDVAGAEGAFRDALERDPLLAEAANNLGNALQTGGRLEEAVAAYDVALRSRPDYAEAHAGRGRALHRLGEVQQAIAAFDAAIRAKPGYARAHRYHADALADAGRRETAERAYEEALRLEPGDGEAVAGLAALAERAGRLEMAIELANRGQTGGSGSLRAGLVAARSERRLGRLEAALTRLDSLDLAGADRELLSAHAFEVAAVCDRLGDYRRAFAAFSLGNAELAAAPAAAIIDRTLFPRMIEKLNDVFTAGWISTWSAPVAAAADDPDDPIFLIGFPRSGTTLLDQILDAHPALTALEEKETVDVVRHDIERLPGGYPQALATLDADALARLRQRYWRAVHDHLGGPFSGRLLDKMPLNTIDAGLIHRLFPRATFLLALRHPCDVVLSNFMQAFQPNAAMIQLSTLDGAARFYAQVMGLWLRYQQLLPVNVLTVRYEDLTADLEGQARRILAGLGLPWDERVLGYAEHARTRAIATPSYHQVVEPIYRRAVGRWHHYAEYLAPVLPVLTPFIRAFGYEEPAPE